MTTSFIYPEGNLCVRKSVIENCYPEFDKIKKITSAEEKISMIDVLKEKIKKDKFNYDLMY